MRIGMILDKEFPFDTRVENEALSLLKAGYQVHLLCFTFNGNSEKIVYKGIITHRLHVAKQFQKKFRNIVTDIPIYSIYWQNKIRDFIRENGIDVLHLHDLPLASTIENTKSKFNTVIVLDLHENYPFALSNYAFTKNFWGRLLISTKKWERKEIEWCNKADYLITVIEEAVERYHSLGIPKEKLTVVANYVNQDEFLSSIKSRTKDNLDILQKFKGKFVVTYIGGFDIHRGLESVIRAMPLLIKKCKDVKLVLVGTGRNLMTLIELSQNLKVDKYISFEGWQPPSILPSYIKGSDVCLIPHLKTVQTDNTIPHKLFQYMLLERPVISTNCNPIRRIVSETRCGLVYRSGDYEGLSDCIMELYEDYELRRQMGKRGKKAVLEKYNWGIASKNLIQLYKTIENSIRYR